MQLGVVIGRLVVGVYCDVVDGAVCDVLVVEDLGVDAVVVEY